MVESQYVRFKREAIAGAKMREDTGHTHFYNKPVSYDKVWEIVKCAFCPSQIMWHPVFEDTNRKEIKS